MQVYMRADRNKATAEEKVWCNDLYEKLRNCTATHLKALNKANTWSISTA